MIPPRDSLERLCSVGVTYRSAPALLRERLAVSEEQESLVYGALEASGFQEVLLLSTCDRVEVLGLGRQETVAERALEALAHCGGLTSTSLQPYALEHRGAEALRHLFAITAGLDSQVVGEPQVLGQVKASHARARLLGASGPCLDRFLAGAYQTAKRVRSESRIGEGPVSLAAAALKVARTLHGSLKDRSLLLIGLGELGELLADYFRVAGVEKSGVLHTNINRAKAVARQLQAQAWSGEDLEEALESADIAVFSQGSGQPVVTKRAMAKILRRRRGRPMLLFDLALPSDLGPGVEQLDNAFVYDLSDLERLALDGKASREGASVQAWRILGEELALFEGSLVVRAADQSVTHLRSHAEDLRREVLENERLDAAAATALLLKRLLHGPSEALRQAAREPADLAALETAMRRLFPQVQDDRLRNREPES